MYYKNYFEFENYIRLKRLLFYLLKSSCLLSPPLREACSARRASSLASQNSRFPKLGLGNEEIKNLPCLQIECVKTFKYFSTRDTNSQSVYIQIDSLSSLVFALIFTFALCATKLTFPVGEAGKKKLYISRIRGNDKCDS